MDTGIVKIHGKEYQTVALRVKKFKEKHPTWAIQTDLIEATEHYVIMKCSILNPELDVIATGHAEEFRNASQINKTSALEVAETSAIGRALAAAGFGGTEFASADELISALKHQEPPKPHPMAEKALRACKTIEELQAAWMKLTPEQRATAESVKEEMKAKINV